jgi:3'-phosphoadenosine 5'-phosphosulfate sulfotransferase (PAPS reductase)/FAD synthetase
MKHCNDLQELLKSLPNNKTIVDNAVIAWSKINSPKYEKILCSVSGGSDSDIMLDIVFKCDKDNKVIYVWFDTGLEFQATKDHLKYLEDLYGIEIIRNKAIKPIPTCCKEFGQPFISKYVSDMISRLQAYDFKWENEPIEVLVERYCEEVPVKNQKSAEFNGKFYQGCVSALRWWCNDYFTMEGFRSHFNINYIYGLKEFIISNPPLFKISANCCTYAKKGVSKNLKKQYKADLEIIGVRKAEGGARATAYKNCFSEYEDSADEYRPLFWYTSQDKLDYEHWFKIKHSDCYEKYGMLRTGCACCPYGWVRENLKDELKVCEVYEPKLYKAVNNVFKDSYEYLDEFLKFRKEFKQKELGIKKLF